MFALTGTSPSRLSSVPSPLLTENDLTERVRTGLYLLDSDNVNILTSSPPHFECLLATGAACFLSSEMDEKLTELVRKCEEFYDMSNKKYSDRVWEEKLWGQTGEELKIIPHVPSILLRILKLLSFVLVTEVLISNK